MAGDITDYAAYCPLCSERLRPVRCKRRCPRCGYYMSCSDFDLRRYPQFEDRPTDE